MILSWIMIETKTKTNISITSPWTVVVHSHSYLLLPWRGMVTRFLKLTITSAASGQKTLARRTQENAAT